ncbi:MAG: YdiU family protein [Nitrospiraceae bacterium]
MRALENLSFDNTFARLPDAFYVRVMPTPLTNPYLVSFNPDVAALIDLDPDEAKRPEFVGCFGGSHLLPGSDPLAMLYSGHQFGHYVSRLGDGRAILLGEVRSQAGGKWDLHLKGAGLTPFSRDDDGRAVLRSTIREYLCSEAMHGLGIPTTRALCIIGSDLPVYRETVETGATLLRLAPSHVRFGSFEVFYYRRQYERIRELADYVIAYQFPSLVGSPDQYARFLHEVATLTGRLLAKWQAVGFAHGVMNSDNMSVLGLTLDYGPYGFLDHYDAGYICNHSDRFGRYAFQHQPDIGYFNMRCIAQALLPLMSEQDAKTALETYEAAFSDHYAELMRAKLGLGETRSEDASLATELLYRLQADRVDYTIFFRRLSSFRQAQREENAAVRDLFRNKEAFDEWAARYRGRLQEEGSHDEERARRMNQANPKYVLRNYLAQAAISRATDERDFSEIDRLRQLLRNPYAEQPEQEQYASAPPEWAEQIFVSCSS